ncbi:hypothetical protein K469DRAFT_707852 [Zopfia rhizophila CBS 207.26]|uniref:Pentatricopeptide repeat protein-like protein n=1 Tax=Zopfia rhizophila CBS 207.26 TaxID=1314779 RepID=A0A6A6E372_9PEZI|nr:hypothetical protein K469DRAFT_707852 [Zopfia rhizophila CBS 207.26]
MSLFRTLDRTTCSTVVSNIAPGPLLTFLCPVICSKRRPIHSARRVFRQSAVNLPPRSLSAASGHMDNLFIQALAKAASCKRHAKQISTLREVEPYSTTYHKPRRKSIVHNESREFKTKAFRSPFKKIKQLAKDELKALVDYYGIQLETGPDDSFVEDDGLQIWNVGDTHEPWPVHGEIHKTYIEKLEALLKNEESSHNEIYSLYKLLPSPGVVYLRTTTIRALLHHLSVVEKANEVSMQRFLSILDDMKTAHIHIIRSEWTSAIYFAGRFMGKISASEVESALYIWKEMEKRAGVNGSSITFNVLFDIAVKAGKFILAEMFLKEMEARKLKIHRHFRTSLLYYHGVRQNGNGVRKTYQDLVTAGDVVDTAVLNAVIAALFRAGEPAAAEHVFERMKKLHASKSHPLPPPGHWREARKLALKLTWDGQCLTKAEDTVDKQQLQDAAPIAPDTRTYGLLIRHHARTAGNIDRVSELFQEMQYNDIPVDGTVFIVILHGFNSFGGVRYSSWTRDRLERVWAGMLKSVESGDGKIYFSAMAVVSALKAFRKCTDAQRTLRAWEEVRKVWEPKTEELEVVMRVLRRLVPEGEFLKKTL